jgi:hypothetical protein
MKTRSKESLHLSDVLKELKASEFKDNHLAAYKVKYLIYIKTIFEWTDKIKLTLLGLYGYSLKKKKS